MKILAHITEHDGIRQEQTLRDHCLQTAKYAVESLEGTSFSHTAYLAGLIHDLGKAKKEYVEYLEAASRGEDVRRGSVNHTFAGLIFLFEKYHADQSSKWERLTCEIISYAVGAHHGLFDCVDLDGQNGFVHRLEKDRLEIGYHEALENFFSEVASEEMVEIHFRKAQQEVQCFFECAAKTYERDGKDVFFQISMLTRLILSAVICGDRRDTSEFMNQRLESGEETDWKVCREYFEQKISRLAQDSKLNQVRNDISRQCRLFAKHPKGIYRLSVPTGAGKTLCSLLYALTHAEKYRKKRIIFIIPLLSVLDQNVRVIRDYLPDSNMVLEHHSNVIHECHQEPEREALDQFELLAESWSKAPVIVSTLVQFLNILFTDRTSAAARMQALCDSVIVIDEVQSLPKKVTVMFNQALNFLEEFCNATIVLSSATQPCFDDLRWPLHLSSAPDMVHLSQEQALVFKRSEIVDCTSPGGMSVEECAAFCAEQMDHHPSLLLVCNTKEEARVLYGKLREEGKENGWDTYHLSTSMCQRHRMDRMNDLQEELALIQMEYRAGNQEHKLICVSTQLIEAGVDLSFSCVVRVLAGLDNLAQAAGRCNRSNEYGQDGKVYLVNLKNENLRMLHEIVNAQNSTRRVLELMKRSGDASYIDEEATRKFYRYLYEETKQEIRYPIKDWGETIYLADLLANVNGSAKSDRRSLLRQPFKTIGSRFKVFDENTVDVLAPYGKGKELSERLLEMKHVAYRLDECGDILREAKPYMISLYEWQRKKLDEEGLILQGCEGRVLILHEQAYHDEYGLISETAQTVERYLIL